MHIESVGHRVQTAGYKCELVDVAGLPGETGDRMDTVRSSDPAWSQIQGYGGTRFGPVGFISCRVASLHPVGMLGIWRDGFGPAAVGVPGSGRSSNGVCKEIFDGWTLQIVGESTPHADAGRSMPVGWFGPRHHFRHWWIRIRTRARIHDLDGL